jgi:polyhydroxybutyrate depolymerase
MRKILLITLLLAAQLSYSQLHADSLRIGAYYRSFHHHKPAADIKGGSLIFIMHGSGGNAKQMLQHTKGLEAIAAKEKFVIVYPDGYRNYWNECRSMSTALANIENVDENAFFRAMIAHFKKLYGIDEKKVFAAGFSGGGHMAYKLAMTMPEAVTAVTAIVANQPDSASSDCAEAKIAVPILIINGTLDPTNPYNGGEMFVNNSSFGVVRSTENTFRYWASIAGYTGEPAKKLLPDIDPHDQKTIECYTYREPHKAEVRLLKVIGGKHDYPSDIDVYRYAWDFFKAQIDHNSKTTSVTRQVVEAACGQCRFGLPGESCDLAVKMNGKVYFVDRTHIDAHGDAHATNGFCQAIRKAEVAGDIVDGRFKVNYFKLLPE